MARPVNPQRSAARREAIVLAAAELFGVNGFEQTTTAQIAKAAGISPGGVFYYFEDKRAVFRAIFQRDLPMSKALVAAALDRDDPLDAVLHVVDQLAEDVMNPLAAGLLVELVRQAGRDPELTRVVHENTTIITDGLAVLLRRCQAADLIDSSLEPGEAAQWIQSIIDGAYLNADPDRDPRPMLRRIVRGFLLSGNDGDTHV
ncbi:MAG TPA: TetR/AcrR family transcriptional regulator [Acidimicrobiales bacterium]|nr:TetR/AcrR family transcriptional regulator [Acidimicrobiales bacterium]